MGQLEDQQRWVDEMNADAIELAPHEDALEFWDKIMRSVHQPIQRRMKAAELRAQYRYPKLGVVATANLTSEDFAACLDRAIARSQVRLIEHHPVEGPKSPEPIPPHGPRREGLFGSPDKRFRR